jgi:CDP-diacylglycerol--serine O-phosphatidyltransferase
MRWSSAALRLAIPNAVTFLTIYSGRTAIHLATDGEFAGAVGALAIAGVADSSDGAPARLLHCTFCFDAEFDSIAAVAPFGIAPTLIVYHGYADPLILRLTRSVTTRASRRGQSAII